MRRMGRKDGGEKRKQKVVMPKVLKYKITESHRSIIINIYRNRIATLVCASPRTKIPLGFSPK